MCIYVYTACVVQFTEATCTCVATHPQLFTYAVVLSTGCAVVIDVYLQAPYKECWSEVKQGLFRQHKNSHQLAEEEALVCPVIRVATLAGLNLASSSVPALAIQRTLLASSKRYAESFEILQGLVI